MTPRRPCAPRLLLVLALCPACPADPDDTTGATSTGGDTEQSAGETTVASEPTGTGGSTGEPTGTSEPTTGEPTTGPDPAYRRDCQGDDFICDDWGCERPPDVVGGECYKPCSPDKGIGEVDSECDEPERPFCSQAGRAFGGDFDCNGCAHICVSAAFNTCNEPATSCKL